MIEVTYDLAKWTCSANDDSATNESSEIRGESVEEGAEDEKQ